jgi:hypothetical protein
MMPNESASPTPNCGGRFARRRSLARAAVNVSQKNAEQRDGIFGNLLPT